MKLGVAGYGIVGKHTAHDIKQSQNELAVYDIKGLGSHDEMNSCDAVFVCVGTPAAQDGSCDVSAIAEVFSWLKAPAIIRSTVTPGTTDKYGAVFVPEFIGEGVNAPYLAMRQPPFVIIGGEKDKRDFAGQVLAQIYNAECEFIYTDAVTAEVCKYAENYFLALKVLWANELYDICEKLGADFGQMMTALAHDYRIGRSHTHVYLDRRGFSGRCLPKDTSALLSAVGEETAPLLAAAIGINKERWNK